MARCGSILCLSLLVVAIFASTNAKVLLIELPKMDPASYTVAKDTISISGISSGGCMATQFHVAHSSSIMGAGIITGAPYWCTILIQNENLFPTKELISRLATWVQSLKRCRSKCVNSDIKLYEISRIDFNANAYTGCAICYSVGSIDDPQNLKNSKVFIFHGTKDTELVLGVAEKVKDFYSYFMDESQIKQNLTLPAAHSFVTKSFGNKCDYFGEPYMNNCGYDSAGAVLTWIYGNDLKNSVSKQNLSNLISFDQSTYVPFPFTAAEISMAKMGYAYIPTNCKNGNNVCKLHVALHGCLQNIDSIGMDFIVHSGYNEWAESNNIIIVYPQTISSPTIPYNPKACWDWWGYTGADYATQLGPQMIALRAIIKSFSIV